MADAEYFYHLHHACSHAMAKESIFYSYTRHINGFAATLDDDVAAEIGSEKSVFCSSYLYLYIYI